MKRMKLGKGKHGFDENGLWYDWDNLSNIKNALWFIAGMQNNNWIKTNKYMSDMQNKIVDMHTPPGCIGEIYVSADCKTYVCWMRNGTGFTFGIAASEGLFPPKKFEGEDVPTIDANDPLVSFKSDQGAEALPNWHASFHIGSSYS